MVGMKSKLFLLLLCAPFVSGVCASAKTALPDACGDDSVKFDVKTEKHQPAPAPPPAGKAQIVLIQSMGRLVMPEFATRFGLDGLWVGANKGDSYFALNVDPGVHHLCATGGGSGFRGTEVASISLEPGKVAYYEGMFLIETNPITFMLSPLTEDEGRDRVKAWKLATWKIKK
jgi:hypothetical protein